MSHQDLLESFRTAYQNLQLLPLLTQEEFNKFGVEYGTDVIDELEQFMEDCTPGADKLIFTGHRGCGKSTLLTEFCRRMDDRYFVVFFSIADLIELSDVNHVNILFAIAMQLMDAARKRKVSIQQTTEKVFYEWLGTYTRTEVPAKEKLESGFNFFGQVQIKLKTNATIREEIRIEFSRKLSDLIDQIEQIAAEIKTATNQEILVVIDDLDKLDLSVVDQVYFNNVKALFQPQFRAIYTVPIAATHDIRLVSTLRSETYRILSMQISRFYTQEIPSEAEPKLLEDQIKIFREILQKRVPDSLMEAGVVDQLILNSGGVLRELIRLASQCCSKVLVQIRRELRKGTEDQNLPGLQLNREILEQALIDLQISFAEPLGQKDYEMLRIIHQGSLPVDAESQRFLDLLHGLYILEYRDTEFRYGLHPIVANLLRQKGLID